MVKQHLPTNPTKAVAVRTVLPHTEACYLCSVRLQSCDEQGKLTARRPQVKGPCLAWVAELDGYMRRMHARCTESAGFKVR